MTAPRVLYFCGSSVIGGIEVFVADCIKEHAKEDKFRSSIFILRDGEFYKWCQSQGINITLSTIDVRLRSLLSWFRFQRAFLHFLKKERIDIVVAPLGYMVIFGSIAARIAKVKFIWFQHGIVSKRLDKLASFFPYDAMLFNSKFTQRAFIDQVGVPKCPSDVILLQPNISFNSEQAKSLNDKHASKHGLLICVGRFEALKGYEVAVKTLEYLATQHIHPNLIFVGDAKTAEQKDYFHLVKTLSSNSPCRNQISFLGFKNNPHDYIAASDILLQTSLVGESFGLVVAEAMYLGTYCLSFDHGGQAEQISNNPKQGTTIPFDLGAEGFASQVERYLAQPSFSNTTKYSIPTRSEQGSMIEQLESVYQEVLSA